jgi:MoxR-like ATPase
MLVGGHILLEDIPGVGKTLLAKYLAKTLGLKLGRIQFTNDLLPSDIVGVNVFNPEDQSFNIQKGPLFNELVLADEINRASPRTQSALLQAMEEKTVSIDNQTFELQTPFFVIATQNPFEHVGVNTLPESQLERFLIRTKIGHPARNHEIDLLRGENRHEMIENLNTYITKSELLEISNIVYNIHIEEKVQNYLVDILEFSRRSSDLKDLSPRSGLDIQKMAKSWAFLEGRDYVIPEDIKIITPYVISHRLFGMELDVEHALEKVKNSILCNILVP